MHVFYTPDIQKSNELPEEEAQLYPCSAAKYRRRNHAYRR